VDVTWKRTANALLLTLVALFLYGRLAGTARADTYFVSTPQELQQAIDTAANLPGDDTIMLAPGIYNVGNTIGSVDLAANSDFGSPVQDDNAITLQGAGASTTVLDGNGADAFEAVISVNGSAPESVVGVTIQDSGAHGDGIEGFSSAITVDDSVIRDNGNAGIEAGALNADGDTLVDNGNAGNGGTNEGGIYIEGRIEANNLTITGNKTGIVVDYTEDTRLLTNSTIVGNGVGLDLLDPLDVFNTILAGNSAGDCDLDSAQTLGDHNLVDDGTCGPPGPGDVLGIDPQLGPLQDNGGPTPTMALAASSPPVDAGDDANCSATDQRGISRPQGAHCDIGAFELVAATNTRPSCSDYSGSVAVGATLSDSAACSDPDAGDSITVAAVTNPGHGTLTLHPDGSFAYTPASGFAGTDSFTFQATDSHGAGSNVATATITVVDQPPTCSTYTGSVAAAGTLDDSVGCTDPDAGDTVTVALVSGAPHGSVTLRADGSFTYAAASGFAGTDSFTYQATDSHGAVSNIATATVTVTNRPPSCSDYSGSVAENGTLTDSVRCSDSDTGDTVHVTAVAQPSNGTLALNGDGTFTYTPAAGFAGTDSFTYQATDSHGATSSIATSTIQVFNTAPGTNVLVQPDPSSPLTVSFASVSAPGVTIATQSGSGPTPPDGFGIPTPGVYWEITTTATYTAPIEVCVPIPTGVSNPRLLHFVNGVGTDVTTRINGNLVCGDVSSLSPFVVAVRVAQQSAVLTYTGATHTVFGPTTLSARLADASNAGLAGETVSFSVDGGPSTSATTAADGTASETTPLPLAPGAHTVSVAFAGDPSHPAAHTSTTVTVANSAHGSVTAVVLSLAAGGALELHAEAGVGGRVQGNLVYASPSHKLYLADTVTALGISSDGRTAWVAGRDDRGHTFLAQAIDGGGHADTLRLWIDGVLADGNGALRLGFVEVDPRH
jgi:VCBS repeat-containing protein